MEIIFVSQFLLMIQLLIASAYASNFQLNFRSSNTHVIINTNQRSLTVERDGRIVQNILLDLDILSANEYEETLQGFVLRNRQREQIEFLVNVDRPDLALFTVARRSRYRSTELSDCVKLKGSNWFGGPEQKNQHWPIQKLQLQNYSYLSKQVDNCAVAERYWLNSLGSFIFVDDETPLFVDQNSREPGCLCLEAKKHLPYDTREETFSFVYQIGVGKDAKEAHLAAVETVLGKPGGHPAEEMVKYPIWSTWARYKRNINESVVLKHADDIAQNGWTNSQFEIDDFWETCYGSLTMNPTKFPDMKQTVSDVKSKGLPRVTLWVHPFINKDCEPFYSEAKENGYLVTDHNGNSDHWWWNSEMNQSASIDFTNPDAAEWFTRRLLNIQELYGIDSFKFDAGETDWITSDAILNGPRSQHPTVYTNDFLRTVAKFGNLIEVRSAHRTQDLAVFVRMLDKDTEWHGTNGLPTLITTLLQMNMVGYPLVLPDMIGGNGYDPGVADGNNPPSKELFIRWLQANVFMPSIQFSYVPFDFDEETVTISKEMTNLHMKYTPLIMERFRAAVSGGYPVNPPIWWVSPEDTVAQVIDDRDDVISAPVVVENARARDIYLPKGKWIDGNFATVYEGPIWLRDYEVPLSMLPYFVRNTLYEKMQ
ncbi:myogenesis-regulating glycosidase-like isoform X2 [Armigeres subalbatus]|uniref:myogenesis-regulating glycosidase-like isoform X2 n=1 Tax=Armigeres subalbatus TaxID=124917 RepID=UPI002ED4C985